MLPRLSWTASMLNAVGRAAPNVTFHFDELVHKAQKRVGTTIWDGVSEFDDGFRWLIEDLQQSDHLSYVGLTGARLMLLNALTKRLEIEQYRQMHSIDHQAPPVSAIIVSPPRTGTTLLYNLLYATGLFRAPLYWELINLASPFDVPKRRERAARTLRRRELLMSLRGIHDIDPTGPEECANLQIFTGLSTVLGALFRLSRYRSRLSQLDRRGPHLRRLYDFHALALNVIANEREQFFQGRPDHRPWLLKAPAHASFIDAVTLKYPDASLIVNLRSPSSFVSSMCALRMALQQPYLLHRPDPRRVGEEVLESAATTYRTLARWSEHNRRRLRIVDYDDLVADPLAAAKNVMDGLGITYAPGDVSRAEAWLNQRLKARNPLRSTLEEYGLSRDAVDEVLNPMIAEIRATGARLGQTRSGAMSVLPTR